MIRFPLVLLWFLVATKSLMAQTQLSAALVANGTNAADAAASATSIATTPMAVAPLIYHVAEEMPGFPGGDAAFAKFLKAKINYPTEALNRGASGKVYISFIVDERGHILDAKVAKGLGYGLDEEALRLVRIMPWWNPGKIQGKPVSVTYTLPIVFRALE